MEINKYVIMFKTRSTEVEILIRKAYGGFVL